MGTLVDGYTLEELKKLTKAILDDDGREIVNPMPLVVPTELDRPLTLKEQITRVLNGERMQKLLDSQGKETLAEANDFDIPDEDPMPLSGYEVDDMVPEAPIPATPPTSESEAVANETNDGNAAVESPIPDTSSSTPESDEGV